MTNINSTESSSFTFAVVPKETVNPFYDQVQEGCMDMARQFEGVACLYIGPPSVNVPQQTAMVRELIQTRRVDGIAMAVVDEQIAGELAQEALDAGIPFITFDSDAPDSKRLLYVGTDNFAFGQSLAKVLLQLNPLGGRYGIIAASAPNIVLRMEGVRDRLRDTKWIETPTSPQDCLDNGTLALQQMRDYAAQEFYPTNAIIPVGAWPMWIPDQWKNYVDRHRNVTLVVSDTNPDQLDLLARTYVDGLVGQVPYQMGSISIQKLLEIQMGAPIGNPLLTTSLVEVVRIPLSLPPVNVNLNQLGSLRICGYVLLAIALASSFGFAVFTYVCRHRRVIIASQPMFLFMIILGVVIMSTAIVPLSLDDGNDSYTERRGKIACMSTPWCVSVGFTVVFSTLFSKTWRINKIFRSKEHFTRVQVSIRDVMAPCLGLLFANVAVLVVWSVFAPLEYIRTPHEGTDDWNRIISTYGACDSREDSTGGATPYLIILGVINVGVMIISNVQAYQARSIQSEFSESHYIGVVMASMLQSCLIGVPILILVRDNPQAYYLVVVFMIFLTSMAVLLLIFVPKVMFVRKYSHDPIEHEINVNRKRMMALPSAHFFDSQHMENSDSARSKNSIRNGPRSYISGVHFKYTSTHREQEYDDDHHSVPKSIKIRTKDEDDDDDDDDDGGEDSKGGLELTSDHGKQPQPSESGDTSVMNSDVTKDSSSIEPRVKFEDAQLSEEMHAST